MVSTVVQDSPNKIFIGGLPNYLNEDQVCILVSMAIQVWHLYCLRLSMEMLVTTGPPAVFLAGNFRYLSAAATRDAKGF